MMPSMSSMSSTATESANRYYIHLCKRCGGDRNFCSCYIKYYEEKPYDKFVKDIPNNAVLFSSIPAIVRRTPSHISGMRGVTLMRRLNKR